MLITLTGVQPLLMHNVRLADPDDVHTRQIAAINGKRGDQTAEDRHEKARLMFGGGLYIDDEIGPHLPAANLVRALRNAANLVKKNRGGKQIERGFHLVALHAPLVYKGPRDADSLWNNGQGRFVDRRMVKIPGGGGRIPVTRPIFPEWQATFEFDLDGSEIDKADLAVYAEKAGRVEGVGDARRLGYGRFVAEISQ